MCGAIHRQHFGLHVLLGGNHQWCFHVALAEGCACCVSGWYGCSWLFQILPKIWVFKAPSSSPGFSKLPSVLRIYVLICVGLAVDYAAHIAHMFKDRTLTSCIGGGCVQFVMKPLGP